ILYMFFFFFFTDTATTEIYTLSLHDALPILLLEPRGDLERRDLCALLVRAEPPSARGPLGLAADPRPGLVHGHLGSLGQRVLRRSEEHTSELQSPCNLVCRLLLEKKKKKKIV